MRNLQHTAISVGIALTTALILLIAGLESGPALIVGAVAGIIASVYLQRRVANRQAALGGSDEPGDIDAAHATAVASVSAMTGQVSELQDENARQVAEQLLGPLSRVVDLTSEPLRKGVIPLIVDQLIEPAQALLTDYLWLQRRSETVARDAMVKIAGRDLPAAEHAARQVEAILERPGSVDVAAIRRAVDFQFSFGGETVLPSEVMWGNRESIVERAGQSGQQRQN